MFKFSSALPASKSWMNRALVIQHFNPQLKIEGSADSEDVKVLTQSLQALANEKTFYLGQGGTSLRFFAFLISRYPGTWDLTAHSRLLERPQTEIQQILNQLGVEVHFHPQKIQIESAGWKPGSKIHCQSKISSQFISGLLLSSWNLEFDLQIEIKKPVVSEEYLNLTIDLLKQSGLQIYFSENAEVIEILIAKEQKSNAAVLKAELDISSAFALVAAAAIDGEVTIQNWSIDSNQPDKAFLEILKKMNIDFHVNKNIFFIQKQSQWNGCDVNLNKSPDLFPVLSVLCALGAGTSYLRGADQLKFKESDRLSKTKELLDLLQFKSEIVGEALLIHGQSSLKDRMKEVIFNPDHDHRMAMAAGLFKLAGYNIRIETPEVVEKSYPQFWRDIGVQP